ncbi:MAG: hypothetical protein RLY97_2323 [Pseudomonadota bacterium]
MKLASKLLGAASLVALFTMGSGSAFAAGTTSGSTIANTVTINFQVAGVNQTAQSATNNVTVDRKVNLTVANVGATTSVSPGQTAAVTSWTITNSSNDVLDIGLAAVNQAGGTAQHGGTDVFDVSNIKYYVMPGNSAVYSAATAVQVTYLDEVAADAVMNVFVVADIPAGATNTQVSGIVLTGTAQAGGTASTQGAVLTATVGANTAGVDTVFADAAGSTDSANDGKHSAKGDYTTSAAVLTVSKLSTLISDPVNGTTNPKAIPGAVMEYCIVVANGAGGATATSLGVSDPVPGTTTYSGAYGIFLNGTVTSGVCNADGTAGGSYNAGTTTVSGTLANLAGGSTSTLRFRVTIN